MSHQTLFLQQSYIDCTNQYTTLLEAPNIPLWDYVVLTASRGAGGILSLRRLNIDWNIICFRHQRTMLFFQTRKESGLEAAVLP